MFLGVFRFEILQCGPVEKLIKKRINLEEHPVYYISIEDTHDVVKREHIATGHGGRDHTTKEINKKYANITRDVLNLYKSYCHEYQKKRKRPFSQRSSLFVHKLIVLICSPWPKINLSGVLSIKTT